MVGYLGSFRGKWFHVDLGGWDHTGGLEPLVGASVVIPWCGVVIQGEVVYFIGGWWSWVVLCGGCVGVRLRVVSWFT